MKNKVRNLARATTGIDHNGERYWTLSERFWVRGAIKAKKASRWREHMELLAYQASFRRGPFGYGPLLMPDGELHATYEGIKP